MFHVVPYGETPVGAGWGTGTGEAQLASDFDRGLLVGLLVGEGHFGGDGRQPQVTLRMHVRHEAIFQWIQRTFPGGRLYGPYHHAERHYYQWMARGSFLRDEIVPVLDAALSREFDRPSYERFFEMRRRYAGRLGGPPLAPAEAGAPPNRGDSGER